MNRQQIKELLPVMQAFAEGKTIQVKDKYNIWHDDKDELLFNLDFQDYRIKPEVTYRPFTNKYECWHEMLKHRPFGWIKTISPEDISYYITEISVNALSAHNNKISFNSAFNLYTFADGTPFGIKE